VAVSSSHGNGRKLKMKRAVWRKQYVITGTARADPFVGVGLMGVAATNACYRDEDQGARPRRAMVSHRRTDSAPNESVIVPMGLSQGDCGQDREAINYVVQNQIIGSFSNEREGNDGAVSFMVMVVHHTRSLYEAK